MRWEIVASQKNGERKWIEKRKNEKEEKKEVLKKSGNKTRSKNNQNWDEFGGILSFLEDNCERVNMMKCFQLSQDIWTHLSHSFK